MTLTAPPAPDHLDDIAMILERMLDGDEPEKRIAHFAAEIAALRAAPASPAGENGRGPGIHNENKAEDLQRLRAALEKIAKFGNQYAGAEAQYLGGIASQALSSVVGEGGQGLSSSCTSLGGDGERAATPAQRKSEGGGS